MHLYPIFLKSVGFDLDRKVSLIEKIPVPWMKNFGQTRLKGTKEIVIHTG